jgi:hypothetical protein
VGEFKDLLKLTTPNFNTEQCQADEQRYNKDELSLNESMKKLLDLWSFEGFTAVAMKSYVLWDVTQCK